MYRNSRGQFATAPDSVGQEEYRKIFDDLNPYQEPATRIPSAEGSLLTYPYLSSLAITPGKDVSSHRGDYGGSVLGYEVGLHIHTRDDGWDEEEPEKPVHFIVENEKIMVIYPDHLLQRMPGSYEYASSSQRMWLHRVREDHRALGIEIREEFVF